MAGKAVNIFWFRRDLRLNDNAGLFYALKSGLPVLTLFIFDTNILNKLPDKSDPRVTFIYDAVAELDEELKTQHSSILIKYGKPEEVWASLLVEFEIKEVFTNNDYEPYARDRDIKVSKILHQGGIKFSTFKDHVIFEKGEILKSDGKPFTVFSAYKRKWLEILRPEFHFKAYQTPKYYSNFFKSNYSLPELNKIGFAKSTLLLPPKEYKPVLSDYNKLRDYPGIEGTSRIGVHLRFGTLSIRKLAAEASLYSETWLSELIWRDFYSMVLWHFPHTADHAFKKEFDNIKWRNNEDEFLAWCEGRTGYPIVDAGMRQLNVTGWMHNRVRMIVASFLCKHLLIYWRWGEAYFASKLLDYDMASNVGGWQWAAGTGNDATPYFRIFNPDLQTKKFDPELKYIKQWIPELNDISKYPMPIVEHKLARERALKTYKAAILNTYSTFKSSISKSSVEKDGTEPEAFPP